MTPAQYIAAIETFLASNIGVTSLRHPDGRSVTISRTEAMSELAYWKSRESAANTGGLFGRSRFGLKGDA